MSLLGGAWDWLQDADNLKTAGTVIGGVAQGYGVYENSKALKEQSNISKDLLAIQKADYNRGIEKEDLAQSNFSSAINSAFPKKKKDPVMDIGA